MRFLYFTYNVVLLHRKLKQSIFHRKSTGRFLHGMPLKRRCRTFTCLRTRVLTGDFYGRQATDSLRPFWQS